MTCNKCSASKPRDQYKNCAECREQASDERRYRYELQQLKTNPYFEPRNMKVDGMTKNERADVFKNKVRAAMNSCPDRGPLEPGYESEVTYCGLCGHETLERNLFKCLCADCRRVIGHRYYLADPEPELAETSA